MSARTSPAIPLFLFPVLLGGCGLASVRGSQDWSAADDPRLALACHVGDYGSGVLLDAAPGELRVLTCAHLVTLGERVPLHFFDRQAGRWRRYEGEVVRRTHPHRQDLALVVARVAELHFPPTHVAIAEPLAAGTEFDAAVINIAFGAEARPFTLPAPALAHLAVVRSHEPDADGTSAWELPKVLVHGGLTSANSGSPVFAGERLVGLVESAPAVATTAGGSMVAGVLVSSPQAVREFLAN